MEHSGAVDMGTVRPAYERITYCVNSVYGIDMTVRCTLVGYLLIHRSLWKKCLTRNKCDCKPVRFRSTGISTFRPFVASTSLFEKFG